MAGLVTLSRRKGSESPANVNRPAARGAYRRDVAEDETSGSGPIRAGAGVSPVARHRRAACPHVRK